jgi:hypothetical protein
MEDDLTKGLDEMDRSLVTENMGGSTAPGQAGKDRTLVTETLPQNRPRPGLHFGKEGKTILLLIFLAWVAAILFGIVWPLASAYFGESVQAEAPPAGTVEIPLKPLYELDYLTKAQVYSLRTGAVNEHPEFAPRIYKPSEDVFGEILDGRPWWGILGLSYFGPGQMSIEGPSLQSHYITNPYLLVGLDEGYAHIVMNNRVAPEAVYPRPTKLLWSRDGTWAKATFDISGLKEQQSRLGFPNGYTHGLEFVAYNARDLGYNWLYIDYGKSANIDMMSRHSLFGFLFGRKDAPVLIKEFIHRGDSCGFQGGCNNVSPYQPEFEFRYYGLPAKIHLKLWRNKPASPQDPADMTYIVEMV